MITVDDWDDIKYAFESSHNADYWSDSNNPNQPWGHTREFAQCQNRECTDRIDLLQRLLDAVE